MPVYCFAIHAKDGSPVETLGALPLSDDTESVTFAEGVIRDMTHAGGATYYLGWTVHITEGKRGVGSIPFAAS
ncbi:MAG: hypothetical protein E6G97_21365 [Alphaproteobacteria bacterium]|nr:MAG: hypothetical protein E6G97_21365 [Alphaproteobacteria bacterium]